MREMILAAAALLLSEEGAGALTVRRLAEAVGASTKVIYSHFGGMPQVVAALYADGFAALATDLREAVRECAGRSARLKAVACAYQRFARTKPHHFDLMYGRRVAVMLPAPKDRMPAKPALAVIVAVFRDEGLTAGDAMSAARRFWAAIHGVVALEHSGWFDAREANKRLQEIIAAQETAPDAAGRSR